MASRVSRQKSNQILLISLLAYAVITLPFIQTAFVIVFGLIAASVIREQQEFALGMFGAFARLITGVRNKAVGMQSSSLRDQALAACRTIDQYPKYMTSVLYRKRQLFFMLAKEHREAAATTYERLLKVQQLQEENFQFLLKLREFAANKFSLSEHEIKEFGQTTQSKGYEDVELLEHFARDWATNETYERSREELFGPILPWIKDKARVLVPGSGLGRLAAEIASNGVEVVDAPELNGLMWLGSLYATSQPQDSRTGNAIYPYLLHFSHLRNGIDQLERVPLGFYGESPTTVNFEYADFLKYKKDYRYDAIVTCFFIDTAQNVFSYIEKIAALLAEGGVWINRGPLKWGSAPYVEFSVDELIAYLESSGWEFLEIWDTGSNKYNGSEKSMLNTRYNLVGWVARRK